jgi:hypothetical protein
MRGFIISAPRLVQGIPAGLVGILQNLRPPGIEPSLIRRASTPSHRTGRRAVRFGSVGDG